jgi:hypothetical protein
MYDVEKSFQSSLPTRKGEKEKNMNMNEDRDTTWTDRYKTRENGKGRVEHNNPGGRKVVKASKQSLINVATACPENLGSYDSKVMYLRSFVFHPSFLFIFSIPPPALFR